ncbi:hypothetical protein [Streptomyces sp. NPDC002666]
MTNRTTAAITATAIAAGMLLTTACSSDGKPLDESAAVMCETFIKKRLKSPGTADFPGVASDEYAKTAVLHDTKPWKYKVTGVVDSQNGFGATVRSNYVCTVSTKDDDTWTLDDMQLTQR